ncbi:MAG: hypothetical protein V3581_04425, partial [Candidatus Cardinium sp.]
MQISSPICTNLYCHFYSDGSIFTLKEDEGALQAARKVWKQDDTIFTDQGILKDKYKNSVLNDNKFNNIPYKTRDIILSTLQKTESVLSIDIKPTDESVERRERATGEDLKLKDIVSNEKFVDNKFNVLKEWIKNPKNFHNSDERDRFLNKWVICNKDKFTIQHLYAAIDMHWTTLVERLLPYVHVSREDYLAHVALKQGNKDPKLLELILQHPAVNADPNAVDTHNNNGSLLNLAIVHNLL